MMTYYDLVDSKGQCKLSMFKAILLKEHYVMFVWLSLCAGY